MLRILTSVYVVCAVDAFPGQAVSRALLAAPSGRWADSRRASRRSEHSVITKDLVIGRRFMRHHTPRNGASVLALSSTQTEGRSAEGSSGVSGEPSHVGDEGKPFPTRKSYGSSIWPITTNLSAASFCRTPREWYRGWRDVLLRASGGGSTVFVAIALLAASLPQVDTTPPMVTLGDSLASSSSDRGVGRQTARVTSDDEVPRAAAPTGYGVEGQDSVVGASGGRRRDVAGDVGTVSLGQGSESLRNSDLAQSIITGGPRQADPLTHGF